MIPQLRFILLFAVAPGNPRKAMENLPAAISSIATCAEMLRQGDSLFQSRTVAPILAIVVDP